MPEEHDNIQHYYEKLFTENPVYSTPYPNTDEAVRWGKIGVFLSQISETHQRPLRILDVGCGRGWLTRLASMYGRCDGVDPVATPIDLGKKYFPDLTFYHGTMETVLQSPEFEPYDVVISSEVIEHVDDKEAFTAHVRRCLTSGGHAIITTPRGEEQQKYVRGGYDEQPVEIWISEKDLRELFQSHHFTAVDHDRAYLELPKASALHRIAADEKFEQLLDQFSLSWLYRGLQYILSIYQIWWFRLT